MKSIITIFSILMLASTVCQAMSKGEYLARAGNCTVCHTLERQPAFSGGKAFPTPIGKIYASNITPDKQYGIGNYTFEDFDNVMRQGEAPEHWLYPVMPYTAYAKLSNEDMRNLYTYFIYEVQPVAQPNKESDIIWPLSIRWPLAIWDWLFHEDDKFVTDPSKSASWNRGAYLVQGLTHCGSCHTPRGIGMQEKALTEVSTDYLTGEELDGWYAVNLRTGNFTVKELARLLKEGRNSTSTTVGPMAETVSHSLQYLSNDEITSIAEYIVSLQDLPMTKPSGKLATASELGALTYFRYCSTCHGMDGAGVAYVIPKLQGNSIVIAENSSTLIRIVKEGSYLPLTNHSFAYPMPGYQDLLTKEELTDVLNYVRSSWGNQTTAVSKGQLD